MPPCIFPFCLCRQSRWCFLPSQFTLVLSMLSSWFMVCGGVFLNLNAIKAPTFHVWTGKALFKLLWGTAPLIAYCSLPSTSALSWLLISQFHMCIFIVIFYLPSLAPWNKIIAIASQMLLKLEAVENEWWKSSGTIDSVYALYVKCTNVPATPIKRTLKSGYH